MGGPRMICRCGRRIEQAPAIYTGPPDVTSKVRQSFICRSCDKRIQGLFPALRERARGDHEGRAFAGRALLPTQRKAS